MSNYCPEEWKLKSLSSIPMPKAHPRTPESMTIFIFSLVLCQIYQQCLATEQALAVLRSSKAYQQTPVLHLITHRALNNINDVGAVKAIIWMWSKIRFTESYISYDVSKNGFWQKLAAFKMETLTYTAHYNQSKNDCLSTIFSKTSWGWSCIVLVQHKINHITC